MTVTTELRLNFPLILLLLLNICYKSGHLLRQQTVDNKEANILLVSIRVDIAQHCAIVDVCSRSCHARWSAVQ